MILIKPGQRSIPTKVLKLLKPKNDISDQLANLFNRQFPTHLKTAKVIPTHNKQSKLEYNNHCPFSLLSNLCKIL